VKTGNGKGRVQFVKYKCRKSVRSGYVVSVAFCFASTPSLTPIGQLSPMGVGAGSYQPLPFERWKIYQKQGLIFCQ